METENWYLEHKSGIMRQVRFFLRHYRKHFKEAYGKQEGEGIASESLQRFEARLLYLGAPLRPLPRVACTDRYTRRSPRVGSGATSGSVAGSPCMSSRSSCPSESIDLVGPG